MWRWATREEFWLPENVTWQEVNELPHYPRTKQLMLAIPLAFGFLVLRYLLDRFLYLPLGTTMGVRCKPVLIEANPVLEKAYKEKHITKNKIKQLSIELGWTIRKVEKWLRQRKGRVSPMKKFKESAWRLTCYAGFVIYGITEHWNKSYVFDIAHCFIPSSIQQVMTESMRWYYLLELGFYVALSMTILTDVRRKDFTIMVIHHVYAITMMLVSWRVNALRVGALTIFCHDIADVPLELAKLMETSKRRALTELFFIIFIIVWVPTRLIYLPHLLFNGIIYGRAFTGPIPYFVLNGVLLSLIGLHLIWTWMIFKILYRLVTVSKCVDERSDTDHSSESEEEDAKAK